ncbi:protein C-terminal S-isoprenylcysteine carboxyl O-methyltransferase [Euphorbia peplus]|nr:protein C-terminal S-isoprenylcysteine carboxyl O-methyltransferase [Euphorbia peplus]
METSSTLLHSNSISFGFPFAIEKNRYFNNKVSLRHFNKHLQPHLSNSSNGCYPIHQTFKPFETPLNLVSPFKSRRTHLLSHVKCSATADSPRNQPWLTLAPLKNLSFDELKDTLLKLTPLGVVKWSFVLSIAIASAKWTVSVLLNPFFWMYFSWTWLFWPWFVAISLAFYGFYCYYKHSLGEASVFEQLGLVTSVFTWLTLVPPAVFNGYLEGWPFVFFFVYHYFFFFNVSIRRRLYGDYYARPHDPKWDVNPPKLYRLLFCVGVIVSHWLAAFEAPELHLIPGGWSNAGIWVLILVTLVMQYNSTLYLAKYSEKVVVPTAVVQFGPYRWVRHPIYASTMLLFASYFVALRAPISLLSVVVVCLVYYGRKAEMEENLMIENFGERYSEYMSKVRYKLIPFVY